MSEARLRDDVWSPPWDDLRRPVESAAAEAGVAIYVVGGVLRDLLLERKPADFDLTVVGEVPGFAQALAQQLEATVEVNGRFQTAELTLGDGRRVDVASARTETYEAAGALPTVAGCDILEDLARRDFTVNTLALGVAGEVESGLLSAPQALEDLGERVIRVLHPASFADDPTRVLRAVRLELTGGFEMEEVTLGLARAALADGHLGGVSGERIWREWKLLFAVCEEPARALQRLESIGFLRALGVGLSWSEVQADRLRRASALALEFVSGGQPGDSASSLQQELILLALCADDGPAGGALAERLSLPRPLRRLLETWSSMARAMPVLARPEALASEAHAALRRLEVSQLAYLSALCGETGASWMRREVFEFRQLQLQVRAEDLLADGALPGPALGQALQRTREARLDGLIESEEELDYASGVLREYEQAEHADADPDEGTDEGDSETRS